MDYMEAMVKNVLCRGLEDSEIQMDLLGGKSQDMTLERVLRFVEAKESGKRSAFCLLLPQSTDYVAGSSYRKQKKVVPEDQETYIYSGTKGHGRNPPTRIKRTECPAYGSKYKSCNRDNHFEKVSRDKVSTKPKNVEHEDIVSYVLCQITSASRKEAIKAGL